MAATIEQFVHNVQNLASQGNYSALYDFIQKSQEVLVRNLSNLDNVLQTFNIETHSLPMLALLVVKFGLGSGPSTDQEAVFIQIKEFISECSGEQVRFGSNLYAELCHILTNNVIDRQQPIRGIPVLVDAIKKIQVFPSQLTSVHADLCQLCLLAKCFKPALQFLDTDITDIAKENGSYDVKYFLLYYYYGGLVYTAVKRFDRALYFYEVCVSTPSMALSMIMLEAYKKYVLVSLILLGKIQSLPKYTSRCVNRSFRQMTQPYHDLATAYDTNNPEEVRKVIQSNQELFATEQNLGLVKQCLTSLFKKNIQRLTKTFITLSLANIAGRVKLSNAKEAEKYLLEMISDGEIFARINQKDGMVEFFDSPVKYNDLSMLKYLDTQMQNCIELDRQVCKMETEIATNPQYLQRSIGGGGHLQQQGAPGPSVSGSGMDDVDGVVSSGTGGGVPAAAAAVPSPSPSPAAAAAPSVAAPAPSAASGAASTSGSAAAGPSTTSANRVTPD